MDAHEESEQAAQTLGVMRTIGLSPNEVWIHYMGCGGGVDQFEFNAYLHGLLHLSVFERDLISHAVNELHDDICRTQRALYSNELPHQYPKPSQPLQAPETPSKP